jgi:FkbM family methyltransferase
LARALFRQSIREFENQVIQGKWGCKYLLPHLKESVSWNIFINGVYEKRTIDYIVSRLPRNGIFIDCGANIGSISIPVGMQRKDVKIFAVEASPWVFAYLKKNIELNSADNITPINVALSDENNKQVHFFCPTDQFGKGSFTNTYSADSQIVITKTLDLIVSTYVSPGVVSFIKIDVEGYEATVLNGAKDALRISMPEILFEFGGWTEESAQGHAAGDAQRLLLGNGYNLFDFNSQLLPVKGTVANNPTMLLASKKSGQRTDKNRNL